MTCVDRIDTSGIAAAPSAAVIADAVLDEAMSGHTTAGSLGLFLNDQYDLAITGITTGVETRAGKHSVAGTVMMSTNAALSGGTLTAKKVSDDSTFQTYTVTTDASAKTSQGFRDVDVVFLLGVRQRSNCGEWVRCRSRYLSGRSG